MLVLHCHWQPPAQPGDAGRLLFWAETSEADPPRAGRSPSTTPARAKPHPYCASTDEVAALLATLTRPAADDVTSATASPQSNGQVAKATRRREPAAGQPGQNGHRPAFGGLPGTVTLWLPSGNYGPQPSPQLTHAWPADEEPARLVPWLVGGLWLAGADAVEALAALPLNSVPLAGTALGADARYWHVAAGVVLEALAGQKLAPTVSQSRGSDGKMVCYARWQAVLDGPQDAERLARLEAAMPPICRAEVWRTDEARGHPHRSKKPSAAAVGDGRMSAGQNAPAPRSLLDGFIQSFADTLARQWGVGIFNRDMAERLPGAAGLATRLAGIDGATGRWLRALFGEDGQVVAPAAQVRALQRSVEAWLRGLQAAGRGAFRVAFRLTPAWHLDYLLQARRDPSLLVPAGEIWDAAGLVYQQLGHRLERPQEQMLAALGYATRLFPPLTRSLKSARPADLELTPEEAFNFLRQAAPLLEQSGFGVLVPPWWNKRGSRLGLRLRARPKQGAGNQPVASHLGFEQLIDFEWRLAVGDTLLTREEFEALVALKSPLVQLRGQWVQLDPEQIEAALRFWQSQEWSGETSLLGALQMSVDAEDHSSSALPVEAVEFEGWLSEWLARLEERDNLVPLPQPAGLHGQLRPYQARGYAWLDFMRRYGLGSCLADDMGLGKTVQTLALLLRDIEQGQARGPVLLICPTSVVGNWLREAQRFAPGLDAWVHQGPGRLRGEEFVAAAQTHDLVLTSYALARRDAESMQTVPWRGVVLDEAQNIKNSEAQQTQVIRRLPAGFRMALTGTPVENRLSELWSIMHFLNPGYLGSREHFRRTFAIPIERYGEEDAGRRLRGLVSPLILRRVKTDPRVIQDLPEKLEMKVYCNLSEEQASLYEAVVQEALGQIENAEGIDRRGQVLAMLLKLKQVCDHPALFMHQAGGGTVAAQGMAGRSGKLDRLAEMLEEALAVDDRALVFTQFAEMGHVLLDYLPAALGRPALFLYGGTPAQQRDQMVARFQSEDGPPIFILSLKAGGVGLNLTRANHVFHFDRWWNPAVEDQATDRAFRIGQTRNVQVHKFVTAGTLEEAIDDMIESKRALAQAIIGAGENWLTELSTDELRRLVTLRREAVAG